jgi:hypothetical protein
MRLTEEQMIQSRIDTAVYEAVELCKYTIFNSFKPPVLQATVMPIDNGYKMHYPSPQEQRDADIKYLKNILEEV